MDFDYLYPSYKKAASKHLTACRKILEKYQNIDIPNYVGWEIYYLSGYIIECCCIYAIYKGTDWDENTRINIIYSDRNTDRNSKEMIIDFEKTTHLTFSEKARYNKTIEKYIKGHNITTYKEYLGDKYIDSDIPFPYVVDKIDNEVEALLDSWRPTIRYVMPTSEQKIASDTIRNLIKVCAEVYNFLDII